MLIKAGLATAAGTLAAGRRLLQAQPVDSPSKSPQPLPNIVVIMADDMGYGDVNCYNADSKIPTPNMDKLAGTGMRFTDAHSPSAVCSPTRYGVLTGRYCWRTRLKHGVLGGYSPPLIEPSRLTLASMLKQKNYTTACIGKWHVGARFHTQDGTPTSREKLVDFSRPITGGPCALGFDYAWWNAGCGAHVPRGFIANNRFAAKEVLHGPGTKGGAGTSPGMTAKGWVTSEMDVVIAEKACAYIEGQSRTKAPFLLYLTPNAPHEPCAETFVPAFARGKSAAGARGDLVWLFDWIVGRVVGALKKSGQADNTLIIVTSDNGALPGTFVVDADGRRVAHGNREFVFERYGHKSCGDLRGYKAHIWDGGHRVPMIACWPGKIKPGAVSDELVCLTDIMATCAAIAGLDLPENAAEDSYNMLPVLRSDDAAGPHAGKPIRKTVVHHSSNGVFSIRQGRWKLVVDSKGSGGWPPPRGGRPQPGTPGQLYDIHADPAERDNLWQQRSDIVARLGALLKQYQETGRSAPSSK